MVGEDTVVRPARRREKSFPRREFRKSSFLGLFVHAAKSKKSKNKWRGDDTVTFVPSNSPRYLLLGYPPLPSHRGSSPGIESAHGEKGTPGPQATCLSATEISMNKLEVERDAGDASGLFSI